MTFSLVKKVCPVVWHSIFPDLSIRGQYLHLGLVQDSFGLKGVVRDCVGTVSTLRWNTVSGVFLVRKCVIMGWRNLFLSISCQEFFLF